MKSHLRKEGLEPGSNEGAEAALERIGREFREYGPDGKFNEMFPRRWFPAAIGILGEGFTEENRLMNSTLKMVRGKIVERH